MELTLCNCHAGYTMSILLLEILVGTYRYIITFYHNGERLSCQHDIGGLVVKNNVKRLLCMLLMMILTGCGINQSSVLDLSEIRTDPSRVIWGASEDSAPSLGDVGLFYIEDCVLMFYDLDLDESYILCGKANCRHNSEKCNAYFPRDIYGVSASNVAQLDGYLYCTYNTTSLDNYNDPAAVKELQLLRIDLGSGERKEIAAFPAAYNAAEDTDSYYATSINSLEYCNGFAWFSLSLYENSAGTSYEQLTGVNLDSGEIVILNENDGNEYSISKVCSDSLYYTRRKDTVPLISQNEFYQLRDVNGTVTIDGNTFREYQEYWICHVNDIPDEYTIFRFRLSDGLSTPVFSGETIYMDDTQCIPYKIWGEWRDKTVYKMNIPDQDGTYSNKYHSGIFLLDTDTGENNLVLELENGDGLSIAGSGARILSDGKLLYAENINDKTADIRMYNFVTGETAELFTDDWRITFRIYGEWADGYIGIHKDHQTQNGYYWISKEDFYAGNLDAMVHYDAG